MRKVIFIILIGILVLVLSSSLYAQEKDPAEMLNVFADSLNAGNVNATMAFFTDDPVVKLFFGNVLPPESYVGSEQVRSLMENLIAINFKIEIEVLQMLGDIAVTRSKTWNDQTIQLGIAPLEMIEVYPIKDGKFQGFVSIVIDESLAKLKDALASK